ncbi:uncharacterized protein LOC120458408 [Drosophila santomea]|uniref:uncharacterized protein LOC120458408 n=1 Tax=Drosophila santomea TaxID=129105 RepID=UPI001952AA8D|nr:uncharacterized protein LOC120458408 [Drosophila santomea]
MPIIAKQTLGNRKDGNGQIAKQTPTCKVGHGLGRRISLTGFSQKVNKYQNYKLREEGATTWLNGNGQNIAVQKKHIKNLGIDVNNFYGGPVITSRPKLSTQRRHIYFAQLGVSKSSDESKLSTETNAPEGDINNMVTQQEQPNKIYWLDNKVSKFQKIMNPEIVRPIDKFTLENLRKCPQRVRDSRNSRVHKRYEKKLSKPINSTTNRRTVVRMSEENVEYDTITLCDFGEITPRNYPEETDSEKWYSSDPDSDDTIIGSSHIDDNISTSEEENVQIGTGYESDISLEETLFTADYNRPIYNIKPVDSDILTLEKGELHSRRKKEVVIFLEGERALLARKVITLSDKEDSDIFTPEDENIQGRMEYESEEEPQCSEKEFTAEYKMPKYNIKPVESDIFTLEKGELHSRRKKEVVTLLKGEGPLLAKKVITLSGKEDSDIFTPEDENIQGRMEYESEEEPQCSEKEFTAEYKMPKYNIKPVDSDIFTLEKGELHSRRKKEVVTLLKGEGPLLAKKVITLSDKEDTDISPSEDEDVQSRMEYESEEEPQCSEKEFTAENTRPKYNIKPVDSDIFTSENGELHSRREKEVVILLEGEGPLLAKKVITLSDKEDTDISPSEDEDVQSRMEYESEEEPQCSEKEFTAENTRPKYNIKPVYSYIFTSENGELHSRREKELVILLVGEGPLLAKKVITLSDKEDTDISPSEDEDVQSRMEYESEEEPQCSEKEFTAENTRPKYNIKPVYSYIFTSENEELHSRRKKELVILLVGEGPLLAKKVITLSDKEDTDISPSEEGFQSEGHEASELTINSEEDKSLLAENDFILDNMNLKNDAQYGKGIEIIDTLLRDDNSNSELRQPSMITFQVTITYCNDSQLWQFLLKTYKELMNNGKLPWMDPKARVCISEFNRPSERHCDLTFLLYVFSGLGNIRTATLVRIDIRFSSNAKEKPSPYLDKLGFDLEKARLAQLLKKAMEVDRIELIMAKRNKQLINNFKRIRILLADKKVKNKRFCCTKKKRRLNSMLRMILRIHPLFIICSVIVISASFLVYHELYFERPKPLTLWKTFLLCFDI